MSRKILSIAVATLLSAATLYANSENMAESLMKLRADVEQLDAAINDEKDTYQAAMKSLYRQKNDLESVVAREDLKIKQIERELEKARAEIKEAGKNTQGLKPLIIDALVALEENIKATIPFKTAERLADIEKIKSQLNGELITPEKALAQTWNAYGDAIRMSKENGVFKQTILVGDEERLAEVARIGTVMMYFKLPDERVGYVTKDANGWFYKEAMAKDQKEQILSLFEAFKKQIRSGYFTLPNAIVMTEVK